MLGPRLNILNKFSEQIPFKNGHKETFFSPSQNSLCMHDFLYIFTRKIIHSTCKRYRSKAWNVWDCTKRKCFEGVSNCSPSNAASKISLSGTEDPLHRKQCIFCHLALLEFIYLSFHSFYTLDALLFLVRPNKGGGVSLMGKFHLFKLVPWRPFIVVGWQIGALMVSFQTHSYLKMILSIKALDSN